MRGKFWGSRRRFVIGTVAVAAAFASLGTLFTSDAAFAQAPGDLVVAPTRVVFDERDRSAQLTLVNKGSETSTFRITVVNMRMNEDGSMVEIAKPDSGQMFAEELFRYSPRQVTLEPGATQAIRLLLRKPKDLAPGEYRSHLLMRAVPKEGGQSVEAPAGGNSLSVQLVPVFGISIPVIVRHGETDYSVSVKDFKVAAPTKTQPTPVANFVLNRTGNRSAFGDLTVTLQKGGSETVLGQIMRLAVYTPNASRQIAMPLQVPDGVSLTGGTLRLTYATVPDEGGKVLAEQSIQLP